MSDALVAELESRRRDRVVFVQALLGLGGGLDVPLQQGMPSAAATSSASMVLPVPGALDQQRALQVRAALTASLRSSVAT
jgi:hypothetical protein